MIASRLATIGINYKLGGYCDEALAIFNRLTGDQPSVALKELVNEVIEGLKTDGVFALGDCLYVRGVHAAEMACQNWIKNAHNSTLVNSPAFTAKEGFKGDGATSYINNNYVPSTDAVNLKLYEGSIVVYQNLITTVNTKGVFGVYRNVTPGISMYMYSYISAAERMYWGDSTYYNGIKFTGSNIVGYEREAGKIKGYNNGVYVSEISVTDNAQLADFNLFELAISVNNSPSSHSNGRNCFSFCGGKLGNTKQLALYTRIKYFFDNVGGTF